LLFDSEPLLKSGATVRARLHVLTSVEYGRCRNSRERKDDIIVCSRCERE